MCRSVFQDLNAAGKSVRGIERASEVGWECWFGTSGSGRVNLVRFEFVEECVEIA